MNTRVLLVDENQMTCNVLRAVLRRYPEFVIVGETPSCKGALSLMRELSPGVIIVDTQLLDMSGLDAARRVLAEFPECKIILLTSLLYTECPKEAESAGVWAMLPKIDTARHLVRIIRQVIKGEKVFAWGNPVPHASGKGLMRENHAQCVKKPGGSS